MCQQDERDAQIWRDFQRLPAHHCNCSANSLGARADTGILKRATHATFARRGAHVKPVDLEPPPDVWRAGFAQLAAEVTAPITTLDAASAEAAAFWRVLHA